MVRNAKKSAQKKSKNNTLSIIETLETRSMMSATPTLMAYLPDYEMTPGMTALLQSSKFEGLTQINYFSIIPDTTGALPETTVGSGPTAHANAATTTSGGYDIDSQLNPLVTSAHAAGVKVSVVIGGAGKSSDTLTTILENGGQTAFDNLAASIQSFATSHHIDGIDLDWEPSDPTAADIAQYGQLIDTIKHGTTGVALSAAVNATPMWLAPDYNGTSYILNSTAIADLDQINVMTYDLGNPGDGAPIAQAETDMNNWVTNGHAPASKLVMGLPFYGSATTLTAAQMPDSNPWTNSDDDNTSNATYGQIVAAAGGNVSTSTDNSANLNIKERIDGTFNGANTKATWHLDGPGTIQAKTNFALNNHFGGVMIWSLGSDSFDVTSADTDGTPLTEQFNSHSLLPVVKNAVDAFNTANPVTPVTPVIPVSNSPAQIAGTLIGTSGSWGNQGNTIANVFDGKLNTYFDAPNAGTAANPDWVGLDFGTPKALTQIKFAARAGYEWRMEGGVFQASSTPDFTSGTVNLYTVGNTVAPSSTSLTTISVGGIYRYVRFLAPAGAYGNIAEMQVCGLNPPLVLDAGLASVFSASQIGSNDNNQN